MAAQTLFKILLALCISIPLMPPVAAHSWVEQIMNIASNGTFTGEPGYPRGNVKRGSPGFSDPTMTYILPPNTRPIDSGVLPTDNICKETQRTRTQTSGSPRLKAVAGAPIALRFQENGHVSLPENQPGKPKNRGYVYVYGTTHPRPDDTFLSIHNVWNADGTGGDKRGVLLSRQNFDDGRCYQINDKPISKMRQQKYPHKANQLMGADMWCQQDIALPETAPTGKPYTLYWVWDWPTAPNADPNLPKGKTEIYTTCIDIDVEEKSPFKKLALGGNESGYVKDQPLNNAAIPSQFAQLKNAPAVSETSRGAKPSTLMTAPCNEHTHYTTRTTTVTVPPVMSATLLPDSTNIPSSRTEPETARASPPAPTQSVLGRIRIPRDGVKPRQAGYKPFRNIKPPL